VSEKESEVIYETWIDLSAALSSLGDRYRAQAIELVAEDSFSGRLRMRRNYLVGHYSGPNADIVEFCGTQEAWMELISGEYLQLLNKVRKLFKDGRIPTSDSDLSGEWIDQAVDLYESVKRWK